MVGGKHGLAVPGEARLSCHATETRSLHIFQASYFGLMKSSNVDWATAMGNGKYWLLVCAGTKNGVSRDNLLLVDARNGWMDLIRNHWKCARIEMFGERV